jgi:hypothetical protein
MYILTCDGRLDDDDEDDDGDYMTMTAPPFSRCAKTDLTKLHQYEAQTHPFPQQYCLKLEQ